MGSGWRVVVGIDGSEGGRRALRWAVREVAARGGIVQAVTSWRWDDIDARGRSVDPSQQRDEAEDLLVRVIDSLPDRQGVVITSQAVEGLPADVLAHAAQGADALVLGSHGHSRVRHIALGSVSEECVRRAPCPVVIVPAPTLPPALGRIELRGGRASAGRVTGRVAGTVA